MFKIGAKIKKSLNKQMYKFIKYTTIIVKVRNYTIYYLMFIIFIFL